jgi:hypothetical protein
VEILQVERIRGFRDEPAKKVSTCALYGVSTVQIQKKHKRTRQRVSLKGRNIDRRKALSGGFLAYRIRA